MSSPKGRNQYAPMEGVVDLREQIARKLEVSYAADFDPMTEITVTCGGTEALYDAIQAVVRAGDDVITFDPTYDVYEPAIRLAGGRCIRVPLSPPRFRFDWDRVRRALTDRTRLIIINSPQNPCCTVASAEDLNALAELIRDRPITILSDEVYEHVVFDGHRHASVLAHPELRERSFAVFSFGKTLHATGWRVGYCVAPPDMTRELRKVHQFNTFSIASPLQYAIALYLSRYPDAWKGLRILPSQARSAGRAAARFRLRARARRGNVFSAGRLQRVEFRVDTDFADRLIREAKVATIPLSPFYAAPPSMTLLRLCLAKKDDTLQNAAERLRAFAVGA
jgi:methionine aminotransferase